LVFENKIVHTSTDVSVAESDPTAHAELNVIRTYCRNNNIFSLKGFTLYSSTEPCVMCSGAIHWARISKVVFSVSQASLKTVSQGTPKPSCASLLSYGGAKPEVIGPVLEDEGLGILKKYPSVPKIERHGTTRR
jgi:tRNA(Arg) A34 adenosine deaminase TadA